MGNLTVNKPLTSGLISGVEARCKYVAIPMVQGALFNRGPRAGEERVDMVKVPKDEAPKMYILPRNS